MDGYAIWFVLPIVLLIEAAVVRFYWRGDDGRYLPGGIDRVFGSLSHNRTGLVAILGLWLAVTIIVWAYEFVFGFLMLNLLLFSFGRVAAVVGLVAFVGVLTMTPVACARIVLKLCHFGTRARPGLPTARV